VARVVGKREPEISETLFHSNMKLWRGGGVSEKRKYNGIGEIGGSERRERKKIGRVLAKGRNSISLLMHY